MINMKLNETVYDLYKNKISIPQIAQLVKRSEASITNMVSKLENKRMTRDKFIKTTTTYNSQMYLYPQKDWVEPNKNPKYQVGEKVNSKYTIEKIYIDECNIRYLCKADAGYREMFFEDDLKGVGDEDI